MPRWVVMSMAALSGALLFAACGGKSIDTDSDDDSTAGNSPAAGGKTQQVAGSPGRAGTGAAGAPSGGSASSGGFGGSLTVEEVCPGYCDRVVNCQPGGEDFPDCPGACRAAGSVFQGTCLQKQLAEFACVGQMPCDEFPVYSDDRRAHPVCGPVYEDLAKSCLYNQGVPPRPCTQFCATSYRCRPDLVLAPPGCEQNCVDVLTGYHARAGTSCSNALKDLYSCFGKLDCTGIDMLLVQQVTPDACLPLTNQQLTACQ